MNILDVIQAVVDWSRKLGTVDMKPLLTEMAAKRSERLDWEHSIVDLMKLLGLDSSLSHRAELAKELGHIGSFTGTADENVWLHEQVMRKLSENGGRVPGSLK